MGFSSLWAHCWASLASPVTSHCGDLSASCGQPSRGGGLDQPSTSGPRISYFGPRISYFLLSRGSGVGGRPSHDVRVCRELLFFFKTVRVRVRHALSVPGPSPCLASSSASPQPPRTSFWACGGLSRGAGPAGTRGRRTSRRTGVARQRVPEEAPGSVLSRVRGGSGQQARPCFVSPLSPKKSQGHLCCPAGLLDWERHSSRVTAEVSGSAEVRGSAGSEVSPRRPQARRPAREGGGF